MPDVATLAVEPVLGYSREVQTGRTYLMSVDLRPVNGQWEWPYEDEEEAVIYCFINAGTLFHCDSLGEPAVVVHRYGGSYGPARFLLTALDAGQCGKVKVTLTNGWGIPLTVLETESIQIHNLVAGEERPSEFAVPRRAVASGSRPIDRVASIHDTLRNDFFISTDATVRHARGQRPDDPHYVFLNVPLMPESFVGREELVTMMVRRLTSGRELAVSAIGPAGVGKTTLAVAIVHHPEVWSHFTNGVMWAGLGTQADVMSAQASWGQALGVDLTHIFSPQERAVALRNAIGMRRMLLVIDDVWDFEAAAALRCGGPNCAYLLTTRDEGIARAFAGPASAERITPLDEEPALHLLNSLAPQACSTAPEVARHLVQAVDGHPLALELLGGYLATPETSYFPELSHAAFDKLADPQVRMELALHRLGSREARTITLQETIALSLEGMPEAQLRAFYALGAFAPSPAVFDHDAALMVTGGNSTSLSILVMRSLLEVRPDRQLLIYPVIADVARTRLPRQAIERHRRYYVDAIGSAGSDWRQVEVLYPQLERAWSQLDKRAITERIEIIEAISTFQQLRGLWSDQVRWNQEALQHAVKPEHKTLLLHNLGVLYHNGGDQRQALKYFERALQIHRELRHRAAEATTLANIASAYTELGDHWQALEYYERALQFYHEFGERMAEATTLASIAKVHRDLGEQWRALEYFERALQFHRELGDRMAEATTLANIAQAYIELGEQWRALEYFERALQLHRDLGNGMEEATLLASIAQVHTERGEHRRALEYFELALQRHRELGDRAGEAAALHNVGSVYSRTGDLESAVNYLKRSLSIFEAMDDQRSQTIVLHNLGALLQQLGDYDEAAETLQRSLSISEAMDDRRSQGIVLHSLSGLLQALGRNNEAAETLQRSLSISEAMDDRRSQTMVLHSLGRLLQRLGRYDEAAETLQRSLSISEAMDDQRSLAMVLTSLGDVLRQLRRYEDAVVALQRSASIFEAIGDQRGLAMVLNSLGNVLQQLGRYKDSVVALQRSTSISEAIGDQRGLAKILNSLGGVLQRLGQFSEAASVLQRSYDLMVENNDQRGQSRVLSSLGGVLQRLGKLDSADQAFLKSIEISERLGDRLQLAKGRTAFGKALVSRGDLTAGIEQLRQGFVLNELVRNIQGLKIVTPILVDALRRQGAHQEASDIVTRALAVAPEAGSILRLSKPKSAPAGDTTSALVTGRIKRILAPMGRPGYGFFTRDDDGKDVYFNEGGIGADVFTKLTVGARVEAQVIVTTRGWQASSIRLLT